MAAKSLAPETTVRSSNSCVGQVPEKHMTDWNTQNGSRLTIVPMRKRSSFVKARKGLRASAEAFSLQIAGRDKSVVTSLPAKEAISSLRLGYTVTKQTGNSVERNRIRRRLRAAVRILARNCQHNAVRGKDAVLIARREVLRQPFETLQKDLCRSLDRLAPKGAKRRPGGYNKKRAK